MRLPGGIRDGLRRMGLLARDADAEGEPLAGGVSSDIWRVRLPSGDIVVKQALARLRVAAEWTAPVERNVYEARWMRAAAAVPGCTPTVLGHDPVGLCLAMSYLPPQSHPLWKDRLRDGVADAAFAAAVGGTLARIHSVTAADAGAPALFPTDAIFSAIRLEPYLLAAAVAHPDRAGALRALAHDTMANKRALVHGDVSPKNILAGPHGPVFLDAECAWWGDPAFDAAFCLNHLLLKCLWTPQATSGFLACFDALAAAWLAGADWENRAQLERRAARLLPGLLLARVDGKSPVEYLTDAGRARVRSVARRLLAEPVASLDAVRDAWEKELSA